MVPRSSPVIETGRMLNPHEILGVQPGAEPEVVDAAYRALMKKYHPDRAPAAGDTAKAQAINAAYAAIRSRSAAVDVATADRTDGIETPITVAITPPVPIGRNLILALVASAAILAVMAVIATSG